MTKRQFTAEYKTKIVLELLREEQNLSEIASKNDISPNQLRNWKREFLENAAKAFSGSKHEKEAKYRDKVTEEEKQELMAKVGQLTIENDWLKKKQLKCLDLTTRKNLISPNSELSIKRQCELLEINRTSVYYTAAIADLEREEQIKSRYIVGWELSDTIDTAPVLEAGKSAIAAYGKPGIINIDQGCQFTSEDYTAFLQTETIRQSMDGKARWVDNVIIERWFRSLKCDNIYINENAAARG